MKDKSLSKLNRKELLELLLEVTKEKESLILEKEQLLQQINEKDLIINEFKSIEETTKQLNSLIQQTHQYLKNGPTMTYVKETKDVIQEEIVVQEVAEDIEQEMLENIQQDEVIEEITEVHEEEIVQEIEESEKVVEETVNEEDLEEFFEDSDEDDEITYKDTYVERLDQFLNEHPSLRSFIDIKEFNND